MKHLALIFLVGHSLFSSPGWGEDYEKGLFAYKSGDFATAMHAWTPLADQGDAKAQFNLGVMYESGQGVPEDDREAVRFYKLAADQGHAKAQYNLGIMYRKGLGVSKDDKEAVRFYKLAADQGHAMARYNLGNMYREGLGVPKDYKEAARWYKLAADQGEVKAQYNLGTMYRNGDGVPEDYKEAARWYKLAADQGEVKAQYNLGTMYRNGDGVPEDYKEAARWYKLAADQGEVRAQYNLGTMYRKGDGVPEDYKEAARWYKLAADQGHAKAQSNLGIMYRRGLGVSKDDKEAVRLYKLAADQGDAKAQFNLGHMYRRGLGVPKDYKEAVRLYKLAADQGDAMAQSNLGIMYRKGLGVSEDYKEAARWYKLAADQGDAKAQYNLGVMYHMGLGVLKDYKEAVRWFKLAAEQEHYMAQFAMGKMYEFGDGVPEDHKEAARWYKLAADQGYGRAKNKLAELGILIEQKKDNQVATSKATSPSSSAISFAQQEAERLRQELEALKAKQQREQRRIDSDTQVPLIKILSSSSDDRRGSIKGKATDNIAVAEVRVDGAVVPLKSDGSFKWQGFIPAGGKSVTIEAIDTAGLSTTQHVRLERGQQNKASGLLFTELNPFRGKTAKKNRNALALIVGVSDYERTPDPAIYADKDAQYFHDYAAIKLGVPDNNIFTMINQDADRIEIKKAVKNWLLRMSVKDETDVYVFFAGHGLASSDGSNMFLLPYDGDPELLEDSAIDRKQLFADIQAISPRSVTVFLDSCYSGGTRAGGTLVASLRPITIRTKEQNVPDGFTILSAAKGDQTSQSLEEAKHGLFSYFLMRGIEGDADANNDNQITAGELHSFLKDKVERQSGFKQTPDLQGDAERVLVRFQ